MGTGPVFNSHEEYSRGRKVALLVQALESAGADVDYVRTMGPAEWAVAAHAAGVKHPGAKSKELVLVAFEARASRRPVALPANPLDGIGLRG